MRSPHLFSFLLLFSFLSCQQAQEHDMFNFPTASAAVAGSEKPKAETAQIVLQSTDGGLNWQDIGAGLPPNTKAESFFAAGGELLLGTTDAVYRSIATSKNIIWEKEEFLPRPLADVATSPAGVVAITDNRGFYQKLTGTDVWMPIFTDFKDKYVRTVFTAKDGSIFIGAETRWGRGQDGIFKSTDGGKTWKHVMHDGWVLEMVESDGVLLCTNMNGILRSTDGGETWEVVLKEGGVGIDVATIKGGFAAITYNTESEARHIHTSKDGGKTWQRIDASLPPSKLISTILQVGDDFYCGHPDGIYRSVDQGKSWFLVVPGDGKKVFNLSTSNGVMYAMLREGGC